MPEIRFSCTLCGRCCYDHSIPLTWEEAITWLEDGGRVGIFCEADLGIGEGATDDLRAAHRRKRSFGVACGSSRARVTAILVAIAAGPCMNLGDDLKCRIYERRPLVCRIYPAEISPFIQLEIKKKACPPEAWETGQPLIANGRVVDSEVQGFVEQSRQTDRDDVPKKGLLCGLLGVDVAAIAGEGYITYEPERKTLLSALQKVSETAAAVLQDGAEEPAWRLYSPSLENMEMLRKLGFEMVTGKLLDERFSFASMQGSQPVNAIPAG